DVALDDALTLTFDKDIQFGAGPQVIRIRRVSDGSVFQSYSVDGVSTDANLSISNSVLTIAHNTLEYNTAYYVTISNGAIESTGGVAFGGLSLDTDWAFTTIAQAPVVTLLTPLNTSTDIAVDQVLSITFDQNIQFSPTLKSIRIRRTSDNSTFQSYLVEGALTDPTLSISGSTLTISHNDFEENTQYYILIDAGAIQSTSGVDFAGFSTNGDWTFT
ncbi:Ig-like domain-containing protein, partial [Carboxylicivirga sediminis]